MDKKNLSQIEAAIEDITTILDDWDLLECSDVAYCKFYDARLKMKILIRGEPEGSS